MSSESTESWEFLAAEGGEKILGIFTWNSVVSVVLPVLSQRCTNLKKHTATRHLSLRFGRTVALVEVGWSRENWFRCVRVEPWVYCRAVDLYLFGRKIGWIHSVWFFWANLFRVSSNLRRNRVEPYPVENTWADSRTELCVSGVSLRV